MSGIDEHHYTNLPNGMSNPSSARIVSMDQTPSPSQSSEKKPRDISKLANLTLVIAVVFFIGSIAYVIQQSTTGSKARADTNASLVVSNGSASSLLNKDMILTASIPQYPKTYKGKPIDQVLIQQGLDKYKAFPADLQKKYVINRLILYYALNDVMQVNKLGGNTDPMTNFEVLNNNVKVFRRDIRLNLLDMADYLFIKADYSQNRGYEAAAKESIQKYHDELVANPANYEAILKKANLDVFLRGINHGEENDYVTNYTADDNQVTEQANFIFDQDFNTILFSLPANKVSDVFTINSQVPYAYVVVYPTRIEKKKYRMTADIIREELSSFTF